MRWATRIVAVACWLVAALCVVMWIRSYRQADRLHGRIWMPEAFVVASKEGGVALMAFKWHGADNWWDWERQSWPVDDEMSFPVGSMDQYDTALGFGWLRDPLYMVMPSTINTPQGPMMVFGAATATLRSAGPIVPYWFLTFAAIGGGAVLWRGVPRFRLRTLMLVMTALAVALVLARFVWRVAGD